MSNTLFGTGRFIEILNNDNNLNNYLKYIVSPITPYLICDHHFSTEIYKGNHKYIEQNIKELLNENTNDLYINKNFDKIKEGDIIQVQVDLFNIFVNNILPQINCKIIVITSQWHLPQINRNQITDEFLIIINLFYGYHIILFMKIIINIWRFHMEYVITLLITTLIL